MRQGQSDLLLVNHKVLPKGGSWLLPVGDKFMVAAVSGTANPLASSQSSSQSKAPAVQPQTSSAKAFQQSLNQYLQNTTSGAGGAIGANPSQSLTSDLMSTLLQMQG
jgi:hypothetical protein